MIRQVTFLRFESRTTAEPIRTMGERLARLAGVVPVGEEVACTIWASTPAELSPTSLR